MLQRIKDKKGFTLVEVIVVLIILAILAALLVPQLTGYIDQANERHVLVEARSLLMAGMTLAADDYAFERTVDDQTCTEANARDLADLVDIGSVDGWNFTVSDGQLDFNYTNDSITVVVTDNDIISIDGVAL